MGIAAAAAAAGIASAGASLGSTIANATSGGPSYGGAGGGNAYVYQPTAQPQADQLYQGIFNSLNGYASQLPSQTIPGYTQYAQNIQNNPYAGLAQAGANQAAGAGQGVAGMQLGGAGALYGAGTGALPYGSEILATGFDPQNALYNRTQQQVSDQLNAVNAMNGVSGTPYGAGVMGQGLSNFNIDWQNQQLARQNAAAQGYSTLTGAAGRNIAGASDLGAAGLGTLSTSSALPYSTYLGQQQNDLGALNSLSSGYSSAFGPDMQLANLLQSYLGMGQSAAGTALAAQQQNFSQNQQLGQSLGASLNALSNNQALSSLFSGGGGQPTSYGAYGVGYGYDPTAFDYSGGGSGDFMAA